MAEGRSGVSAAWAVLLFPLFIITAGLAVDHWNAFSRLREFVHGGVVPDSLLHSTRSGREFRLLDQSGVNGLAWQSIDTSLAPAQLPSSINLRPDVIASGLGLMSIVTDEEGLWDGRYGIMANPDERGRSWERAASVTYFVNGGLQFATGAGIRVHGGVSRSMPNKSLRVYFRQVYGAGSVPSDAIFAGQSFPMDSLVVHNDARGMYEGEWRFMNPLGYDIARAVGGLAPRTTPAVLFLNGESLGLYMLTEHLSADYISARLGHDDFVLAKGKRTKGKGGSQIEHGDGRRYRRLSRWLVDAPAPLQMATVAQKVDLENLTNWFIAILFVGATDPFQGRAVLDTSTPEGKWYWITWDVDHAFRDARETLDNAWELDLFPSLLDYRDDPRAVIFSRLGRESPAYRRFFRRRFEHVLSCVLTTAFLEQRVAYYQNIADAYGLTDQAFFPRLKSYLKNRPAVLRRQVAAYFGPTAGTLTAGHASPLEVRQDQCATRAAHPKAATPAG